MTDVSDSGAQLPRPVTLEDALLQIETLALISPVMLRRLRSDVSMAANCVWKSKTHSRTSKPMTPADLPCNPVELRPLLQLVLPARFWLDKPGKVRDEAAPDRFQRVKHRWSNIRSSISRVLRLCGWMDCNRSSTVEITADWVEVGDCHAHPTQKALANNFARHCIRNSVALEQVSDQTIESFRTYLSERTLDPNVTATVNATRRVWEISRTKLNGKLPVLTKRRRPKSYVLPDDALPPSFIEDVERYLALLMKPGPFEGARLGRPRAPVTLKYLSESFRRYASVAQAAGIEVTSVSALGKPAAVRAILTDQYDRLGSGKAWPAGAVSIASYLKMVVKHSSDLTDKESIESNKLCANVKGPKFGLTRRSRNLINTLGDPKVLTRLMKTPFVCYRLADSRCKLFHEASASNGVQPQRLGNVRAAQLHQYALALHILSVKPLRRSSLASLDLERHFSFDSDGMPVFLSIPGEETKNGQDIEALLPRSLGSRLKIHLEKYRPLLTVRASPYLFPGKREGHLHPQSLGNGIVALASDYAGLRLHTHIMRHLCATALFDLSPENGPIAQRMLDHTSLKTTTRFYGMQRTRGAQAKYAKALETLCAEWLDENGFEDDDYGREDKEKK